MTYDETLKIFAVLKANYSNFFKDITRQDAEAQVRLWCEMFEDDTYTAVGAAVKAYIATDTSGYPPNVGKIKSCLLKFMQAEEELTEIEATNRILKAVERGIYNSVEEFEKLPETLKRLVGSATRLREWALMDSDELNSVVASNLMRSYRAIKESGRQTAVLPASIRNVISQIADSKRLDNNSLPEAPQN
ncbi:MAG: hypothetical protein IKK53_02385 [Ruminiclostridium sp.]|nr:hypothetical protein [Ruminiclostridium sp.]